MQEFLIFKYHLDGINYIDAYPTFNRPASELLKNFPDNFDRSFIFTTSRTQARKQAYIKWIEPSGKGFNKYPFRRLRSLFKENNY